MGPSEPSEPSELSELSGAALDSLTHNSPWQVRQLCSEPGGDEPAGRPVPRQHPVPLLPHHRARRRAAGVAQPPAAAALQRHLDAGVADEAERQR